MITINISISGGNEVIKRLKVFENDLNDWRSTFDTIGDYLIDTYKRLVFTTEGGYLGDRWPDLSPYYEVEKAKRWPGRGILEASGTLKGGFRKEVTASSVSIVNPVEYGIYHQSDEPRATNLPRRAFVGMNETIEKQIVQYFVDGVTGKIRKAFA